MTMIRVLVGVAFASTLLVTGCGGEEPGPCRTLRGECVGVPPGRVCEDSVCTQSVKCSSVVELEDGEGLKAAAAKAKAGTCIALDEGSYGAVALPAGVSLLGIGAGFVHVGSITIQGVGGRGVLRGLSVKGTVDVGSAAVDIDAVLVDAALDGIRAASGADLVVRSSEVRGADDHAVIALDVARIAIERSVLEDAGGPGLWATCAAGCECATRPDARLTHSLVQRTAHVGINLGGVTATLDTVDILDTRQRISGTFDTNGGNGLAIASCADVTATNVHIVGLESTGVLVHHASAKLGGNEDKGIIVIGGRYGVWLQDVGAGGIDQTAIVENVAIEDVAGVGLGFGGESVGMIVIGGRVAHTTLNELPVFEAAEGGVNAGVGNVGDGVAWTDGAQAQIMGLSLEGNARASLLIDGSVGAGSSIANVTLAGGDETKGIVQQKAGTGVEPPAVGANAPPVQQISGTEFSVAAPPALPSSITEP